MKKQISASPDRSIIFVKKGDGYEIRVWNRFTGDAPIGARLGRKDGLPNLTTEADTSDTAIDLQKRWQAWLDAQPNTGRRKGKQRS